jgi:hypothetical protein
MYGHCLEENVFVIWYHQTFHMTQTYSNRMESQHFVDITNFIKIQDVVMYFYLCKYILMGESMVKYTPKKM